MVYERLCLLIQSDELRPDRRHHFEAGRLACASKIRGAQRLLARLFPRYRRKYVRSFSAGCESRLITLGLAQKHCNVQSLFNHYKPRRDHRPVPRDQPLRRQPAADARSLS